MRSVYALMCFVCLGLAAPALAQSGPAEQPPADFEGQQYVDSFGCVFMRAVIGGQVQWVARLTADRVPLCGVDPTSGEGSAEAVAAEVADPPEVAASVQPAAKVAAKAKAPASTAKKTGPRKIGCYVSAPVPLRVPLQGGGTTVVCTPGNGTLTGWRPPIYPDPPVTVATPAAPASSAPQVASPAPTVTTAPATGLIYVQLGAFAVAGNADRASAKLKALGLPEARGALDADGRRLTTVAAGPFSDRAVALTAQQALRSAGYGDAYIR